MITTGKYTKKRYRCALEDCGYEYEAGSNHYGEIYSLCPECKLLSGERFHRSECITPLPEGWGRPEPWAMTTIYLRAQVGTKEDQ